MFQPFRLRELELKNRVVVSPMDMYRAVDGLPNDFHLAHLGGKALGGAGLVMTEMVCVSAPGRITPGCTGLYRPEHEAGVGGGSSTSCTSQHRQDRPPARPLRAQGLDQAHVGGHRRAAPRRQLGGRRAVAAAVPAGRQPGAARAHASTRWTRSATSSCASAEMGRGPASTCSSCTARTATCCPASSRRSRTSAPTTYGGSLANRLRYPARGVRRHARGLAQRSGR